MNKVLTIAGSDCSGGAGIQADLKTMTAHGVYGMSVIAALTAQNTTGVFGVLETDPVFIGQQMDCVFGDILPEAVKIGMISSSGAVDIICEKLKLYKAQNIVVDPVMISTSGARLLSEEAMGSLVGSLIPMADIITPNLMEARALSGIDIESQSDMEKGAVIISKMLSGAVLIKGGHLENSANDLLYMNGKFIWIDGERVDTPDTHGTGCTLSSAIACNLAMGYPMETSVRLAKAYITGALRAGLRLGKGRGPLNHCWAMQECIDK